MSKERGQIMEFQCGTIEEIRELKHFVNLGSSENQSILLAHIDKASEAAQNALLKTLEEPGRKTTFILTAENEEQVLATVRSRCEVIRVSYSPNLESLEVYNQFEQMTVGEKIKRISEITKREDAVDFLKTLIEGGSIALKEKHSVYSLIENAQVALQRIEGNANVQIQLTNFCVQHLSRKHD